MKKTTIITMLCAVASAFMLSCENFRDNNGDLGGEWQLLQWRTRSSSGEIDSLVANNLRNDSTAPNPRKLYYSFRREVMQIRDAQNFVNMRYFCHFSVVGDSLLVGNIIESDGKMFVDAQNPDSANLKFLQGFGLPVERRYHIDNLTDDCLQLSTPHSILQFRKH